jgi:hypothetical protein
MVKSEVELEHSDAAVHAIQPKHSAPAPTTKRPSHHVLYRNVWMRWLQEERKKRTAKTILAVREG